MFVWTDASRRWHLAAARACTYHDDLARALSPWIGPGDHAAELGCGLGLLALRLAGQAARVTAVDIDAPCLDLGRAERERAGIRNVDFQCRDALALAEDEVWDVVVACLFGNLAVNARYFLARARRCVLALVDTGGPKTSLVPEAARRRKPPAGEIALALERDGISFTRTDLAFEFGQPFADMDEARAFIRHYSAAPLAPAEIDACLERRLEQRADGLYLPHTKRLTLFALSPAGPAGTR